MTVVVCLESGVAITEPRLDPGAALLTFTVTLVVGVVAVALTVVLAAVPPVPPLVLIAALVPDPEPRLDPAEIEPRLANTWLNPATPETPMPASKQNDEADSKVQTIK